MPTVHSNNFYSASSFIAFILVCIPFPWHWEAQNAGTCIYMFWAALACLNLFINSVVWARNAINWAPVWCDISSRIILAVGIGIPAASLCINRRLFYIAAGNSVTTTKAQKRRSIIIDVAIGIGLPLLQSVLQYIIQGHRFDIYEEIGCFPTQHDSWPVIPIQLLWPLIIGLISLFYCSRTIYHFMKRRNTFKELLSNNTDMSHNRYLRLMCLAGIEALCTVPLSVYNMYFDIKAMLPYKGWADLHWRFGRVSQYPSMLWRLSPDLVWALEATRWFPVICALIFFCFFGFAEEARKHYRIAYTSVTKRLGYSTASMSSIGVTSSTTDMRSKNFPFLMSNGKGLPIVVNKETSSKRDSFGSFNLTIVDVGGTLDDYKAPIYTPTASSGGSSVTRSNSFISISSPTDVESSSVAESPSLTRPAPVLDITNVTRRSAESSPVRPSRPPSLKLEDVV